MYRAQTRNSFRRAICKPMFVLTESDLSTEKNVWARKWQMWCYRRENMHTPHSAVRREWPSAAGSVSDDGPGEHTL